jgi:chaperonin GroEL
MQKRDVLFGEDFERKIKKGVNTLADAVKTTMGPKGKLVLIQKQGHPTITKDGVTVANAINLIDEVENLGATVIREAAARTADEAGDGTTTATVLAQAIYTEGLKMKSAGFQTDLLNAGIKKASKAVIESLKKKKKNITSDEELKQVAMISANGEEDIANLIVDALKASGVDGSIIVEEAKGFKSDLTVVEGFRLERGFLSPYFVTDNDKMIADYNQCLVILANKSFDNIREIMKPLEMALEMSKPLLIIGNDFDNEVIQSLVLNKVKANLKVCAIKSPGFGASRHEMLHDLQAVLGGTVIDSSFDMGSFTEENFGKVKRAIIHKASSMLVSSKEKLSKEKMNKRISAIKEKLVDPSVEKPERVLLNYRLQQLSGGISILRVGAATESELIERYDRVDDALHATKAAMQEGVLPGGGVALARCTKVVDKLISKEKDANIISGMNIVKKSLVEPFKQIIRNGSNSPETILSDVMAAKDNVGYNSRNDELGDMFEQGVLDPHKVVRCALQNATSAASMLLNVGCCMIDTNITEKTNID